MAQGRLNLTVLLKHLDTNNFEVYEAYRHNEAERKELDRLVGYMLPLWMSGTANGAEQARITLEFNRHVNIDWRELEGHPELRAKVLAVIGSGKQVKHDFHHRGTRKQTALTALLAQQYPDIRKEEIALWCRTNNEAALVELCRSLGVQQKEREAIVDEYRNFV